MNYSTGKWEGVYLTDDVSSLAGGHRFYDKEGILKEAIKDYSAGTHSIITVEDSR